MTDKELNLGLQVQVGQTLSFSKESKMPSGTKYNFEPASNMVKTTPPPITAVSHVDRILEIDKVEKPFFIQPHGARIIVQYDKFYYGGRLVIPDTAKRLGTTGHIVAVGPDVDKNIFHIGDRVMWATFSGTQFKFRDKVPFNILSSDEIQGHVSKELEGVELELEYSSAG